MREYGWDKVVKAAAYYVLDGDGTLYEEGEALKAAVAAYRAADVSDRIVDSHVFVTTDRGDVFARSPKRGETASEIAAHYRKRGWTDAELCLFKAK